MTEAKQKIEPVTRWENKEVKGHALCSDFVFQDHLTNAQALRDRQAAYLNSLPTDPTDVIKAAREIMHPGYVNEYPEGIEEALHLSVALEAMIKAGDLDVEGRPRDAALYVAEHVCTAMHRAVRALDRLNHVLGQPDLQRAFEAK